MPDVTISEAVAAMRTSPQGRYTALEFGYSSVDEFAASLESDANVLASRMAPVIIKRLADAEARAEARAEREDMEAFGRKVVEALRYYAKLNGRQMRDI